MGIHIDSQVKHLKSQMPPSNYRMHRHRRFGLRNNITKEKIWLRVLESFPEIESQQVIQKNPDQRQANFRSHEQATREMIMTDIMNAQTGTASFSVDFSPSGRQASVHNRHTINWIPNPLQEKLSSKLARSLPSNGQGNGLKNCIVSTELFRSPNVLGIQVFEAGNNRHLLLMKHLVHRLPLLPLRGRGSNGLGQLRTRSSASFRLRALRSLTLGSIRRPPSLRGDALVKRARGGRSWRTTTGGKCRANVVVHPLHMVSEIPSTSKAISRLGAVTSRKVA